MVENEQGLKSVIEYLKDSNAAEELILDEIGSYNYTLASTDSKDFIGEVPSLLSRIGNLLESLINISKDIVNNGTTLLREEREKETEEKVKKGATIDQAKSGITFSSLLTEAKEKKG